MYIYNIHWHILAHVNIHSHTYILTHSHSRNSWTHKLIHTHKRSHPARSKMYIYTHSQSYMLTHTCSLACILTRIHERLIHTFFPTLTHFHIHTDAGRPGFDTPGLNAPNPNRVSWDCWFLLDVCCSPLFLGSSLSALGLQAATAHSQQHPIDWQHPAC